MSKQPSDDIFGNFFLTERDDDLLASGSRDPLGFEAMWVHVAHLVIPGLNTQSIGARNFAVVWLLHWVVDRWLSDLAQNSPADLEDVDLEVLRRHCLLVAETTYVLSVRERWAKQGDIDLDNLYGRGGALQLWEEHETSAPITTRGNQILSGQFDSGHFGRYDAPLRTFGILAETASASDGTRVLATEPLEQFLEMDWFQAVQASLRSWFDRVLREEEPSFTLGNFKTRTKLTQLREWETLARLADDLCGSNRLAVEATPGEPASTAQACVWRQLEKRKTGAIEVYDDALETADGEARGWLHQARTLELFLSQVEAFFDVCWQSNVAEATVGDAYSELKDWLSQNKGTLEVVEHELKTRGAVTGAERLQRLRRAVRDNPDRSTYQEWLVEDYHKPMMVEERKNNAWLSLEDGEVRPLNGTYAPANPFSGGEAKPWRKRDYYLGTLESFHRDIQKARNDSAHKS